VLRFRDYNQRLYVVNSLVVPILVISGTIDIGEVMQVNARQRNTGIDCVHSMRISSVYSQ
jgi:hypothetical protein